MNKRKGKVIGMGGNHNNHFNEIRPNKTQQYIVRIVILSWEEVTMFKEVPAVQSPNGQKSMLPIPVVRCAECGHVSEKFLPKELLP